MLSAYLTLGLSVSQRQAMLRLMNNMFITPPDILALTGYKRAADQILWLTARHWVFELGGDGRPRILRAYAERRLGGIESEPPHREPRLRLKSA